LITQPLDVDLRVARRIDLPQWIMARTHLVQIAALEILDDYIRNCHSFLRIARPPLVLMLSVTLRFLRSALSVIVALIIGEALEVWEASKVYFF
jgi:hypothetical protein